MARIKYYDKEKKQWLYADNSGGGDEVSVQKKSDPIPETAEIVVFTDEPEKVNNLGITGASVDQFVKIASIDEQGVPTGYKTETIPYAEGEKM